MSTEALELGEAACDIRFGSMGWAVAGIGIACLVAVPWIMFSGTVSNIAFPVDDAAITLANARALLGGADPVHVGVSPFFGATSTVHLFLTTALLVLTGDVRAAGFVTALVCIALYVMALGRMADRGGQNGFWVVLAGLCAALMPFQLNNGLETVLAATAIAYVLGSLCGPTLGNPRVTGAVLAAMPFIRPELGLFVVMVFGLIGGKAWRGKGVERDCIYALVGGLEVAGLVLAVFGIPLVPSTVTVKRHVFVTDWGLDSVSVAMAGFAVAVIALLGLAYRLLPGSRTSIWIFGWAALHIAVLVATAQQAALSNIGRYLSVLAPVAAYGVAVSLRLTMWRGAAILAILIAPTVMATSYYVDMMHVGRSVWRDAALFVASEVKDGERVMAHDIGEMSLRAGRPVVDAVGLKTSWVAAMMVAANPDRSRSGRDAAFRSVVGTARPDWIIAIDGQGGWRIFVDMAEALGARAEVRRSFGCDLRSSRTVCMRAWRITWPEAGS